MRILVVDSEGEASFPRPDLHLHSQWNVVRSESISSFEAELSRAVPAIDLAIVYQDRPKQLTQSTILRCFKARPLTRILQVLGPWCDGDLRTPGRVAGVYPISFRDAKWRLAKIVDEFRLSAGPLVQPLTTPETATDFASLLCNTSDRKPLRVGIRLPGRLASGAAASLAALGHSPVIEDANSDQDVDVRLMEGDSEETAPTKIPTLFLRGFSRNAANGSLAKTHSLAELDAALMAITASATIREPRTSQSHTNR